MAAFSDTAFDTNAFSVDAFSFGTQPAPTPEAPEGPRPSGGFPYRDRRSRKEIDEARRRFGVIPPEVDEVIEAVAQRQAESPAPPDEHKYFEELERELELRGLEWQRRYLEALTARREQIRREENDIRTLIALVGLI